MAYVKKHVRLRTPEYVVDYEVARLPELSGLLRTLNEEGFEIISVTQDTLDRYTIFFRRPAYG